MRLTMDESISVHTATAKLKESLLWLQAFQALVLLAEDAGEDTAHLHPH